MPIPTVDSAKKTASKKLRRGDPDIPTLQPLGLEKELQEVTMDNKVQLRTWRTDYVSATNPKILSIHGDSWEFGS